MASFADSLDIELRPYLGSATEAYVKSLAASVGKNVGSLDGTDLTAVLGELKGSISAVAGSGTIRKIVDDYPHSALTSRLAISMRTWVLAVTGTLGLIAFALVVFAPPPDAGWARYLAYLDDVFIISAAVAIVRIAASFAAGTVLWRQWMYIGLGVTAFAIGDVVWAFNELVLNRAVSTPGLPDLFYVITTAALALGVSRAALAFRRVSIKTQTPLIVASILTGALVLGESVFVLGGVVRDPALSLAAKALNLYYPLADIALLLGPGIFIVLVVLGLGKGSLGWPWWAVAAGLACMSVSDIVFSAMQVSGSYVAGSPVDLGWMAGYMLLAIGASVAYDVAHPFHRIPA